MSLRTLSLTLFAIALAAGTASAQSLEEEQAAAEGEEGTGQTTTEQDIERLSGDEESGESAEGEGEGPAEPERPNTDPYEEPNRDYYFLGAFYRHVVVPGAIQDLFVAGGIDGSNPGVGLSFNWRKNNFNLVANIWWANAQGEGFFRAEGDPRTDTEHILVDLGVVFINAEFLWSFPIVDWFAVELGFDLGFGFVYGDLIRTEAYETSPGADDWQRCNGPNDPNNPYCEAPRAPDPCYNNSGAHYDCHEANWFSEGGDIPVIMPWVALPHFALRFKPIHQVQIRLDVSYNLYAISFGGGVSYGF